MHTQPIANTPDKTPRNDFDPAKIDYDEKGLVPVVTCDAFTNEPLMLAYMNAEALRLTVETRIAHYYSRSRRKIWKKGETSGNTQTVVSIASDCDGDAVLLKVIQKGVACHTGKRSCFDTARTDFCFPTSAE